MAAHRSRTTPQARGRRPTSAMETPLTNRHTTALILLALLAMACAPRSSPAPLLGGPPADLKAGAATLYQAYGVALTTPHRNAIAGFYHHEGAVVVLDGVSRRLSRADLQRKYEGAWSPPAFFAWDALTFDSIGPGEVIVTGGFRWQGAGQRDTVPYIYAALLVAVDSGLAIVFEHETRRPRP